MPATEVIFISTSLEAEHAERIRAAAGAASEIIHEPDLHPLPRYQGDHTGAPGFVRSAEQEARWLSHLARATILWDFPPGASGSAAGLTLAPNVRWVQTTSAGVGQSVKRMGLAERPLIVTTSSGVHAGPLAEFVFLALLAQAKHLARLGREQRARRWERYCCGELEGQTLLIAGAGKIGKRCGEIARAFGMRTIGIVSRPSPERAAELGLDEVFGPSGLAAALPRADAVVLCMPHTPETEGMISAAAIAAMKRGAALINVARGAVVDEPALTAALRSGQIGFAALDVTAVEPLPSSSPLWDMENVLISPHSASTAPGENRRIADIFCRNLDAYLGGRLHDMVNVLDKQRLY